MKERAVRPPILSVAAGPPVRLELAIPTDLDCFRGHFPGCPILPGVVQLDWAIRLADEYLGTGRDVARILALKFRRIVRPGARLTLWLTPSADGMSFRYEGDGEICSSGRIACAR